MVKSLAYKAVMFLIKHFLLRDAWLVATTVNKNGEIQSISYPEQIKVVFLGNEFFGFVDKTKSVLEGVEFRIDTPQCVSFSANEYLYDNFEDAEELYIQLNDKVKPEKPKIIAKGPSYDKKSAPVKYAPIGPRRVYKGKSKKTGRKK